MLFFSKLLEHIEFILNNTYESVILFFIAVLISMFIVNLLYKERISTLGERLKLSNDLLEFYKNLNIELENRATANIETKVDVKAQPTEHVKKKDTHKTKNQSSVPNSIEQAMLKAIDDEKSKDLPASSMKIINSIQSKYDLSDILSELVRMHHQGTLTWDNAPAFPEHWMELKTT